MITKDNLDVNKLKEILTRFNVPFDQWGKGESKTFESLVEEIQKGESVFDELLGLRRVGTVIVDLRCGDHRLVEELQRFADGRERKRALPFGALGEKLFIAEPLTHGLARMLKEELKIILSENKTDVAVFFVETKEFTSASASYPGLTTHNIHYRHIANISLSLLFKLGGQNFVSTEETKTTFYRWEKM